MAATKTNKAPAKASAKAVRSRVGRETRETKETRVSIEVNLDGSGVNEISTGIGYFDHMLEQLSRHSLLDMKIAAEGDLHIDCHHTVEDVGLALGTALKAAIGDKAGIRRYGSASIVMDEAKTVVDLDFSGRPYSVWNVAFSQERLGELDTEMVGHFFHSMAMNAALTFHASNLYGENNHHICESVFKAAARAMREALEIDPRMMGHVPSTKGVL